MAVRAGKTFVQTAVSCLITTLGGRDLFAGGEEALFWPGLLLSACAAGLSAVWNGVLTPVVRHWMGETSR